MKHLAIFSKAKKALAVIGIGLLFVQGVVMMTATPVRAAQSESENGSCCPDCSCVCGLNGTNYENKKYQSGNSTFEQ